MVSRCLPAEALPVRQAGSAQAGVAPPCHPE